MRISQLIYSGWMIFLALLSVSCISDVPKPNEIVILEGSENGVFICNEGNFQFGNASVSYYSKENKEVIPDYFYRQNQFPLGDVCQSMVFHEGKFYLVVNNSGKVEVLDPIDFTVSKTIDGMNSPRYFLGVSKSKAYVSDLYAKGLWILDLKDGSISGTIKLSGWSEEMYYGYGKVFIAKQDGSHLWIVDAAGDKLIDSIETGYGPTGLLEDRKGRLWVLCTGRQDPLEEPGLWCLDPVERVVIKKLIFNGSASPPHSLAINGNSDHLYFSRGGVYRMHIDDENLPELPIIPGDSRNIYAMAVDPVSDDLYIADALDYIQRGKIYRYDKNATPIDTFLAGVIPGFFFFP